MKQYFVLGVGLLAGTMIGAAAVTGLHAQAKAPVFLITEIDVSNPEAYGKEFCPEGSSHHQGSGREIRAHRRSRRSISETD